MADSLVARGDDDEVLADTTEIYEAAERNSDIVIDVTGKTLVPGFVDTHYHAQWLVPEVHPQKVWQYLVQTGG